MISVNKTYYRYIDVDGDFRTNQVTLITKFSTSNANKLI